MLSNYIPFLITILTNHYVLMIHDDFKNLMYIFDFCINNILPQVQLTKQCLYVCMFIDSIALAIKKSLHTYAIQLEGVYI